VGDKASSGALTTRERILDVAEEIIGRDGIEGMRLRDLADPVGIRVPSIYAHFKGREDVLRGVLERYIDAMTEQFPDNLAEDPALTLDRGVRDYSYFMATHPAFVRLQLRDQEMAGGMPEMDLAAGGTVTENFEIGPLAELYRRITNILRRGAERGEFRELELTAFMRGMQGIVLLSLSYPATLSIVDARASAEQIAETVDEIAEACRRLVIKL
jgi:AcrR family transcriptional regulator